MSLEIKPLLEPTKAVMGACNDLRFVFPYTGNLTAEKKTEMARKLCGWWNSDAGWEALKKNGRFRTDIRLDMANSLGFFDRFCGRYKSVEAKTVVLTTGAEMVSYAGDNCGGSIEPHNFVIIR
ncbi:TPA: hypothetical protein MJB77_12875 [Klebsiella pneumoniae]|jgi:hypothetical protein|uniref:hypothetical protein n=1 Tax=Klebsiella TaxID=570 RepID=UPI000735B6B0|nr:MULTISPECIES: hypothetical protein [Klebsiella]ELQ7419288.1 hypothetical protein [Klebsiella oxytoca]MDU1357466.1 hypothetical protein [Citrobacter freundii]HBQ3760829.1 hypothetical protein [Klebsiella quasipneumoniae subsp. similipneumoniae]HDG7890867.1 hypothetical protein [Klebsiella quasipneumoniae]EKU2991633.1 hypothetical protein [Klebsiella pneumoniae]